jgi:hypothetical protein
MPSPTRLRITPEFTFTFGFFFGGEGSVLSGGGGLLFDNGSGLFDDGRGGSSLFLVEDAAEIHGVGTDDGTGGEYCLEYLHFCCVFIWLLGGIVIME